MSSRTNTVSLALANGQEFPLVLNDVAIKRYASRAGAARAARALNQLAAQEAEARELARIAKESRTSWDQVKRENEL